MDPLSSGVLFQRGAPRRRGPAAAPAAPVAPPPATAPVPAPAPAAPAMGLPAFAVVQAAAEAPPRRAPSRRATKGKPSSLWDDIFSKDGGDGEDNEDSDYEPAPVEPKKPKPTRRLKVSGPESWSRDDLRLLGTVRVQVPAETEGYWEQVAALLNERSESGLTRSGAECQHIVYKCFDKGKPSATAPPKTRKRKPETLGGKGTEKAVRQRREFGELAAAASDDDDVFTAAHMATDTKVAALNRLRELFVEPAAGAGAGVALPTASDVSYHTVTFPDSSQPLGLELVELGVPGGLKVVFVEGIRNRVAKGPGGFVANDALVQVNDTRIVGKGIAFVQSLLKELGTEAARLTCCRVKVAPPLEDALFDIPTPGPGPSGKAAKATRADEESPGQEFDAFSPGLLRQDANRPRADAIIARSKKQAQGSLMFRLSQQSVDATPSSQPTVETVEAQETAAGRVLEGALTPGGTAKVNVRAADSDASSSDEDFGE